MFENNYPCTSREVDELCKIQEQEKLIIKREQQRIEEIARNRYDEQVALLLKQISALNEQNNKLELSRKSNFIWAIVSTVIGVCGIISAMVIAIVK